MGQVTAEVLAPPLPVAAADRRAFRRQLIGRLESAALGTRAADGAISVRRGEPAGCILYGPYMHLPEGCYRLSFHCRSGTPRLVTQPVIGVEVIVLSRFQVGWRDFTATELAGGSGSVDFTVTREHSLESENEGRFEFRFFHLGNADLVITAVDVEGLPPERTGTAPLRRWRLLGRLEKSWRGRRDRTGGVSAPRFAPAGPLLLGGWPYLRLAGGNYRLTVDARAGPARRPDRPVIRVEVFGQSRWRGRRLLTRLAHRRETKGLLLAARDVTAAEIEAEPVAVDFAVPTDMALEAGADAPFDIRLHHLGIARLSIRSVDLVRLDQQDTPFVAAPRLRPAGRRKIVMIGNCQMETLRQGFARVDALSSRFDVKYHFVQLPRNMHEFVIRDLESCDILLAQDIRLWDEFPLRDCVRAGADVLKFPLVRFASLWPFDTWNGPGDRLPHDREGPNLTFPYLDGLLGRLREEIPDREARFDAYRTLVVPGVINCRRFHQLEAHRLTQMDKKFNLNIGSFILDHFQHRRIFHTTVRPNWQVFNLLMQYVAQLIGAGRIALTKGIDVSLRNPQVPVHPKVARELGVKWADETTRYFNHGRELTWEAYIRSYIAHYG